jgi:hypothetical protein
VWPSYHQGSPQRVDPNMVQFNLLLRLFSKFEQQISWRGQFRPISSSSYTGKKEKKNQSFFGAIEIKCEGTFRVNL